MEPVTSHWQDHNALGEALIGGLKDNGIKLNGQGSMAIDLTQTSYSTYHLWTLNLAIHVQTTVTAHSIH